MTTAAEYILEVITSEWKTIRELKSMILLKYSVLVYSVTLYAALTKLQAAGKVRKEKIRHVSHWSLTELDVEDES